VRELVRAFKRGGAAPRNQPPPIASGDKDRSGKEAVARTPSERSLKLDPRSDPYRNRFRAEPFLPLHQKTKLTSGLDKQ